MQPYKRTGGHLGPGGAFLMALTLALTVRMLEPGHTLAQEPAVVPGAGLVQGAAGPASGDGAAPAGGAAGAALAGGQAPAGAGRPAGGDGPTLPGGAASVIGGGTASAIGGAPGGTGGNPGGAAGGDGALVVVSGPAGGAGAPGTASPTGPGGANPKAVYTGRITSVQLLGRGEEDLECHLGDVLEVTFENPKSVRELKELAARGNKLGLFLDGTFLKGIVALPVPGKPDKLRFELSRTPENETAWGRLLGGRLTEKRAAELAVGLEDGEAVALWEVDDKRLSLVPLHDKIAGILGVVIAVFIVVAGWLVVNTPLLRDGGIRRSDGLLNTFSLGRTQMFVWFSLVFVAFLFIWAVTGAPPLITTTLLTLMGISGSTGLGSVVIQNSKRKLADEELKTTLDARVLALKDLETLQEKLASALPDDRAALETQLKETRTRLKTLEDKISPASDGILRDLLTDEDSTDYTLHRLQIFIWTGVMVVLFLTEVYSRLLMPEFSTNLLALLGISSLTYIGFKFPATS